MGGCPGCWGGFAGGFLGLLVEYVVGYLVDWFGCKSDGEINSFEREMYFHVYKIYVCVYKYLYIYIHVMSILYLDSTSCHFIRSFVLASLLVILTWHIGTWLLAGKVGPL